MNRGAAIKSIADAEWMLEYLSNRFQECKPQLIVHEFYTPEQEANQLFRFPGFEDRTRGCGAVYDYADARILIDPSGWNPQKRTTVLLHEFAHHLGHVQGHGSRFTRNLVDVITAWRGHPGRYPWRDEYATVQKWARKLGALKGSTGIQGAKWQS